MSGGKVPTISICRFDRGEVIGPGAQAGLKIRSMFLHVLQAAFEGGALVNRLYTREMKTHEGTMMVHYTPVATLKSDASSIIVRHLKESLACVTKDEETFIKEFVIPKLAPEAKGKMSQERKSWSDELLRSLVNPGNRAALAMIEYLAINLRS